MARKTPEVNAGSMADIAFLLLIFFLVTTTMDVDSGITRMLPPPPDKDVEPPDINERNVFVVLVNSKDQLMVDGVPGSIVTLREEAKEFIQNPYNKSSLSDKKPLTKFLEDPDKSPEYYQKYKDAKAILGMDYPVSKGVISLQNDRGTSYEMYILVQNELAAAVKELRNELSKEIFGVTYERLEELKAEEKLKAIKTAIPMTVSEAEPKDIGGNQ